MKNIIVGTAGHIDHGKTALVKALTGIDADRLAEEKRRGITIDLGFAHLQVTPGLRLGFVDVPGHERFVRNMLAGASGIDLVLFVVAADESIKPQTREHFDICRLLGIEQGIVVITKSDLVPADLVELVQLEMEEFVAGSFLEGAPVIAVSAKTGEGLDALKLAIEKCADRVRPRDTQGPARLPIDRAFSMRGFGTVVTGTLLSGAVVKDASLELLPPHRTLRVRGLQVYGQPTARAEAGTRTAINLLDIDPHAIERGMVLAEAGCFEPVLTVDCSVELLSSARRLKNRAPVHFHSGSAEIEARIRFFSNEALQNGAMEPGGRTFARLRFATPAVLAPGDRFIIRQFSPVLTIGGGVVIDVKPPRERRSAAIQNRLEILAGVDEISKAALLIQESVSGMSDRELGRRLAMNPASALALAQQAKAVVLKESGWLLDRDWLTGVRRDLLKAVQLHHAKEPLAAGIPKPDLRARTLPHAPSFVFDAALAGIPELAVEGDSVRHRTHRVALNVDEEGARRKIEQAFAGAGLAVPTVLEVLGATGLDANRGQTLLRMLLKEGLLIRVSAELVFHHSAIANLKRELAARKGQSFTVSVFKDWTGISRKYAVPLLEFLDREHVTSRSGDVRVVVESK